jgi:hypothetical protein
MVCEVTGERAKYRDPKTGKAFASSSAFRALRERYDLNERKKMYGLDEESKARDALFRQQQQEAMDTSDTAPIAYTQAPLHAQYAQYLPVGSGVQSVPIGPNMVIPPMASHRFVSTIPFISVSTLSHVVRLGENLFADLFVLSN